MSKAKPAPDPQEALRELARERLEERVGCRWGLLQQRRLEEHWKAWGARDPHHGEAAALAKALERALAVPERSAGFAQWVHQNRTFLERMREQAAPYASAASLKGRAAIVGAFDTWLESEWLDAFDRDAFESAWADHRGGFLGSDSTATAADLACLSILLLDVATVRTGESAADAFAREVEAMKKARFRYWPR